ncbi:MAG TPA: hypothetical protein VM344_02340 [Vitreimonas sp.]|nr:hypothetical protein [Vitreimonas sp.]
MATEEEARANCAVRTGQLARAGRALYVTGWTFGPDRVEGRTDQTNGYGDERMVAAAIVVEIAAEAADGAVALLDQGRVYASSAILRQVLECEYLLTAFALDADWAREWLNADGETLRRIFSPQRMRDRSGGRFRDTEYWAHCKRGGHPTPEARALLTAHSQVPMVEWWRELSMHLDRVWTAVEAAAEPLRFGAVLKEAVRPP